MYLGVAKSSVNLVSLTKFQEKIVSVTETRKASSLHSKLALVLFGVLKHWFMP